MEVKLKDDLIELKRRLEQELEDAEKGVEDEVLRFCTLSPLSYK